MKNENASSVVARAPSTRARATFRRRATDDVENASPSHRASAHRRPRARARRRDAPRRFFFPGSTRRKLTFFFLRFHRDRERPETATLEEGAGANASRG